MKQTKLESQSNIRIAAIPLLLFTFFLIFLAIYQLLGLPSSIELLEIAKDYYERYGYWVIFFGALIEGTLFINWYLPGSLVIVFGILFSRQGSLNPFIVVILVVLAFFIGVILNYAAGKYGWHRLFLRIGLASPLERIRCKVLKRGLPIIFSTYFHPNIGALTATSCGVLRLPFRKFLLYSILALVGWNSLLGGLIYLIGPTVMDFLNLLNVWVIIAMFVTWILVAIIRSLLQKRLIKTTKP